MADFYGSKSAPLDARPGDIWRNPNTRIAQVLNYDNQWELLDTVLRRRTIDPSLNAARAALAHLLKHKG